MMTMRTTLLTLAALALLAPTALALPLEVLSPTLGIGNAVNIANFQFDPEILVAPLGNTVTFTNHDAIAHTSTENGGAWNTGPILPGTTATVTITTPGVYSYHCAIHPAMIGYVVILAVL